jgi:hypothetical protein
MINLTKIQISEDIQFLQKSNLARMKHPSFNFLKNIDKEKKVNPTNY